MCLGLNLGPLSVDPFLAFEPIIVPNQAQVPRCPSLLGNTNQRVKVLAFQSVDERTAIL